MERFPDLSDEKKKERKEWLKEFRTHLAGQHAHWSEKLIRNLILADTGGIAVVVSLMANNAALLKSFALRLALTFFVAGVLFSLVSLYHEFADTTERLEDWDENSGRYRSGEVSLEELRNLDGIHNQIDWRDRVIGWTPAGLFLLGCVAALMFLWWQ